MDNLMPRTSKKEIIRKCILNTIEKRPFNISKTICEEFKVTRQYANRVVDEMISEGILVSKGRGESRKCSPAMQENWKKILKIEKCIDENDVWNKMIRAKIEPFVSRNVLDIWHRGFTEMVNNAVDHSEGSKLTVYFSRTSAYIRICLLDNGIGIFKKIRNAFALEDERHAMIELSKGRLTSDSKNHTGEEIFFTSRIFDEFLIKSEGLFFSHNELKNTNLIADIGDSFKGTLVCMKITNYSIRTEEEIFDTFTSYNVEGIPDFTHTIVPMRMALYGDEKLVSRSQAKRLVNRIDKFSTVIFDFTGVRGIGQGFSDQIFRVFKNEHPGMELIYAGANESIENMILKSLKRPHARNSQNP